ncbi:protein RRP5 homolog [Uloborus diversus]|uniref:protein RRP5 homolog n=1 Tax=Uloborus diversus TaxID=327109 RepID=UPI00240A012C|nr:protein RRP5 homolog [Uloborus diversus]
MNFKDFDPKSSKFQEVSSIKEAEALVAAYPNSSKAWLMYMTCCLKQEETNKARSIAKRALQTINFREDGEKLNVWKALLNLENHYGTDESIDKIFKEALIYNDQKKIYYHIMDILIAAKKSEKLEEVLKTALKKFKTDKEFWIKICSYYMQSGNQKEARNYYSRSLQCTIPKEHADIMGKFAHLEYKFGDLERSFSMYEEILVKYPKRKDLRSVYVHLLKQQGQNERANVLTNFV